jgi:hypothetical protein
MSAPSARGNSSEVTNGVTTDTLTVETAYSRYTKTREALWKQEDMKSDYFIGEQAMNDMDRATFEGMYELICAQHRSWYEDRHAKAQRIIQMEKDLDITETRRYTMDVLMDMDPTGLTCVHDKVSSSHNQLLQARLAEFTAEERKIFRKSDTEDLESKLGEMDFYDSNDNDDFDDEDGDGLVVYQGRA